MSKKGKNIIIKSAKTGRKGSPTARVTAALKKGKLKGKNKKNLKYSCTGHIINDRGKVKPKIKVENGLCECKVCGQTFPTKLYTNEYISKQASKNRSFYHQVLFVGQATGVGNDTLNFIADANDRDAKAYKAGKRILKIARKKQKISDKSKNKNKNNGFKGGTESYGSWG